MAISGGYRDGGKIPVEDFDWHVQSLRAGLTAEDPKYRKPERWKETTKTGGEPRRATVVSMGEMSEELTERVNNLEKPSDPPQLRDTASHGDFASFNFTTLEDTRMLTRVDDTWLEEREVQHLLMFRAILRHRLTMRKLTCGFKTNPETACFYCSICP